MILSILLITLSYAEELPTNSIAEVESSRSCISSTATIDSIMQHQSDHRKDAHSSSTTPHPRYGAYISNLTQSSGSDILARLIYAEVREARCPGINDSMQPLIAEAILNRIEKRFKTLYPNSTKKIHELSYAEQKSLVESVVFQKSQFASSLHKYRVSAKSTKPTQYSNGYKSFLCPSQDSLWLSTKNMTDQFFRNGERPRTLPSDTFNYYLFQHAPNRWDPPAWTRTLTESSAQESATLRRCLRLYQEPAFR